MTKIKHVLSSINQLNLYSVLTNIGRIRKNDIYKKGREIMNRSIYA